MEASTLSIVTHSILHFFLSLIVGIFIGYKLCEWKMKNESPDNHCDSDSEEYSDDSDSESEDEDDNPGFLCSCSYKRLDYSMKMVLCVRRDLPMTKGKTCAQCCHAAVGAVGRAHRYTKEIYKKWNRSGCKKVTLSCPDEATFLALCDDAEKSGLNSYAVCDAGRTQLEPNTLTVLAIGPDREDRIDKITGREGSHPLKLL